MNRLSLKGLLCDNAKSVCLGDVLMKRSEARRGSARAPPDASRHDSISMEESYVETKVEALEGNRVKVSVTIDAKQVDSRIKQAYAQAAKKYNFPGFRKGKAPRPVIDNALGKDYIAATVSDDLVNETYPVAIDDSDIYPVGNPKFDEEGMDLVANGKDFSFSFEVEVKPEFELSSYEPVEIELPAEGATDEEVETQIDELREHYFELVDATAATKVKPENWVEIAIKATDDAGEDIPSITTESRLWGMDSTLLPQAFNDELMGMKKGQTKEFDIDVPAEADATVMTQALVGKTAKIHFEVEVKVVKKKVVPELTDEWTKEKLGFESVEDMRTRIAESIKAQKDDILPRMKELSCLGELAKRVEGEVPAALCEQYETQLLQDFFQQLQRQGMTFDAYLADQGVTADQFKDDVKQQAADNVKQDLALDAWARHFDLKVTDEDLAEEFKNSGAKDPKKLEKEWRETGRLHLLREGIMRSNAAKDVMDKAVITEMKPLGSEEKKPAKKAAAKKTSSKKKEEASDAE